jgi:NTE family protein
MYNNLALQGGGVWGISYAGAFEELDSLGILQNIRCVAGTSAGSMAGLLLALGFTSQEIIHIIRSVNYKRFLDHGRINNIVRQYGYYPADYALGLFHHWIDKKLGSADATFDDLLAAGGLDLRVYATNLNTRHVYEFSYQKTPDASLADAVRASIAVPLFFTAAEVNGQIFVDGGAVFEYPIMGFGKDEIDKTLGLAFAQSSVVARFDQEDSMFSFRQPRQYIHRMFTVLERVQSPIFALNDDLQRNTVLIETGGVQPLNFKLTNAEKDLLIANGRQAVREHFNPYSSSGDTTLASL